MIRADYIITNRLLIKRENGSIVENDLKRVINEKFVPLYVGTNEANTELQVSTIYDVNDGYIDGFNEYFDTTEMR